MRIHHIAIMASGTGSNARAILRRLEAHDNIKVALLLTNKSTSGISQISEDFNVPYLLFNRDEFKDETYFLQHLKSHKVDFIILAGFLWLIPSYLVDVYEDRILNIHPSLLPKYGGKGMYGKHVHQAVFDNKDQLSGLTIHLVNKHYDEGQALYQKEIDVSDCNSPDQIAEKILTNEHMTYPEIIISYISNFKES